MSHAISKVIFPYGSHKLDITHATYCWVQKNHVILDCGLKTFIFPTETCEKAAELAQTIFRCKGNLAPHVIPFLINNFEFSRVGSATNFSSSLVPCPLAMVARSRQKICAASLPNSKLFMRNGINQDSDLSGKNFYKVTLDQLVNLREPINKKDPFFDLPRRLRNVLDDCSGLGFHLDDFPCHVKKIFEMPPKTILRTHEEMLKERFHDLPIRKAVPEEVWNALYRYLFDGADAFYQCLFHKVAYSAANDSRRIFRDWWAEYTRVASLSETCIIQQHFIPERDM